MLKHFLVILIFLNIPHRTGFFLNLLSSLRPRHAMPCWSSIPFDWVDQSLRLPCFNQCQGCGFFLPSLEVTIAQVYFIFTRWSELIVKMRWIERCTERMHRNSQVLEPYSAWFAYLSGQSAGAELKTIWSNIGYMSCCCICFMFNET